MRFFSNIRVLIAALTIIFAQSTSVAVAQEIAFQRVIVEGSQRVTRETVLSYLGLDQSGTVSAAALNDGYQRLVAAGLFESVEIIPRGSALVVKVVEAPTINIVSVEGNKRLKDEIFSDVLKSKPRHVFSAAVVEDDVQTMIEMYQSQGRLAARVTPRIIRRSDNRVDLVFEVVEGKNTEVERVSFVGNRIFSDYRLRRALGTKQAGIFRAIVSSDTYIPQRVAFDKQVLTDFYRGRGYVDFVVTGTSSEFSRERDAFFLTFQLLEGLQYRFGKIAVVSEYNGVEVDPFEAVAKLKSGEIYSASLVDNAVSRMEVLATRQGHDFLRVEPRVTRNPKTQTIDIELVISRGPRLIVERIDIRGNATTLDRVVRNQFTTIEGDPFDPAEIRKTAERLRALGFFSDAKINTSEGSASDRVVLDVDVQEQPTGNFGLGGTFSSSTGFGMNISISERNFLGRGQYLSGSFNNSSDTASFNLSFAEPNFFDRNLRFGLDAEFAETNQSSSIYSARSINFRPSLTFPTSASTTLGLRAYVAGTELSSTDASNSSPVLQSEIARGRQIGVGGGLTFNYDSRRVGLDNRRGVIMTLNGDLAGFGSDYEYVKATAKIQSFAKIFSEQVTLSAVVEGGMLASLNGGDSRISDRFRLGTSQLRGFRFNEVGPRDLTVTNQDALGGNFYAVARLEAKFPLGLPDEYGLSGGVFIDAGSLWGLDNTNNGAIDDSAQLRASIGASIFWDTPIGPLRFNFSRALEKQSYDEDQDFEFTISTSF